MLDELGVLSDVAAVGSEDWKLAEDAVYGGTYDKWDLKTMIQKKINFALESAEILPSDEKTIDKDMENLVRLGQRSAQMELAMFIDRSEDEQNDLAAAEWYKVYGVIYGQTEKAEQLYQAAVNAASEKEKTEAEALLKTRAEEKAKMKADAKEAAGKQAQEG